MLLNLLSVGTKVSIGDAALYAFIGFLVVFLGISFLVLVVWSVGKIFTSFTANAEMKNVKPASPVTPVNILANDTAENDIPEETVAVIMAALMAYYQTTQPKCEFTVKRIKRI